MAKNYAALLRKMLSPRREPFDGAALGPSGFEFRGRRVRRDDFQVQNDRGLELACSLWRDEGHGAPGAPPSPGGFRPLSRFRSAKKDRRFCVLYVHDVGGSRLGALSCLGVALDAGAAGYCAFDTTACGRSGGAHVSFGHFERWDVGAVAQELVKRRGFTDVVLWGRGAGAVAALLYARFAQAPPAKRRSSKESWEWSDYYGGSGGPACGLQSTVKEIATAMRKAARGFLRGLEVSTMTVMWVVSKPPLYVSAVAKGSAAADCGLEVGDVIAGIGSSMRLPHTADEFAEILLKLAERPRPDLVVHVYRDATAGELAALPLPAGRARGARVGLRRRLAVRGRRRAQGPRPRARARAGDAPRARAEFRVGHPVPQHPEARELRPDGDQGHGRRGRGAQRARALRRQRLLRPRPGHPEARRADVHGLRRLQGRREEPRPLQQPAPARAPRHARRAGSPPFVSVSHVRSSRRLDAMSSKFLNKAFVFLQGLDGFEPVPTTAAGAGGAAMPRWVVTTRPWAQTEAEQTIDDYESAQIVFDQGGQGS